MLIAAQFLSFNSMKVRLKQDNEYFYIDFNTFQFHEGPIKTVRSAIDNVSGKVFQFHEGPIKTVRTKFGGLSVPRFNSMKVRLKPGESLIVVVEAGVSIP